MRLSWRRPRAAKVPDPVVEFPCTAFRNSLFAVAGNLSKSDRRRRGFSAVWRLGLGQNQKIPCFFPDDQGIFPIESGSHQTASSASESSVFVILLLSA